MSQQVVAPGKNFLLVTGILMTLFAVFGILGGVGGLSDAAYWDDIMPLGFMSWSMYYLLALLGSLYDLFMGIMGIVNRARPEKAGFCKTLAIISIVLVVIFAILGSLAAGAASSDIVGGEIGAEVGAAVGAAVGGIAMIFSLVIGLILPILYFVGAHKNQAALRAGN